MFIVFYDGAVIADRDDGTCPGKVIRETLRDVLTAVTEFMYQRPDWPLVTIYKLRPVYLDQDRD